MKRSKIMVLGKISQIQTNIACEPVYMHAQDINVKRELWEGTRGGNGHVTCDMETEGVLSGGRNLKKGEKDRRG